MDAAEAGDHHGPEGRVVPDAGDQLDPGPGHPLDDEPGAVATRQSPREFREGCPHGVRPVEIQSDESELGLVQEVRGGALERDRVSHPGCGLHGLVRRGDGLAGHHGDARLAHEPEAIPLGEGPGLSRCGSPPLGQRLICSGRGVWRLRRLGAADPVSDGGQGRAHAAEIRDPGLREDGADLNDQLVVRRGGEFVFGQSSKRGQDREVGRTSAALTRRLADSSVMGRAATLSRPVLPWRIDLGRPDRAYFLDGRGWLCSC